jgi:trypsin
MTMHNPSAGHARPSAATAALGALLALLAAHPAGAADLARSSRGSERIVGGVEVEPGVYGFPVSIQQQFDGGTFEHICGGSLIRPMDSTFSDGTSTVTGWSNEAKDARWVLTAAHCITDWSGDPVAPDTLRVVSGTVELDAVSEDCDGSGNPATGLIQPVEAVFPHIDYDAYSNSYDFGLLRLPEVPAPCRANLGRRPIKLPHSTDAQWINQPYTAMTVAGWGRLSEGGFGDNRLRQVVVPLVDAATCDAAYANIGSRIWPEMLCAGYQTGGFDACQGDSGGPMFYRPRSTLGQPVRQPVLVGVVSWGEGCARGTGMFGVYARVVYALDWIEETILDNP